MFKYALAACAMMVCAGSAQAATTISFTPLMLKSSVPVSYTESGYTLTSNTTSERFGVTINDTLNLVKSIGAEGDGIPSVSLVSGTSFDVSGGTFSFDGISLYFMGSSSKPVNTMDVVGYLDGKEIYSSAFVNGGGVKEKVSSFYRFTTGSDLVFDKLTFSADSNKSPIYLDNITLTAKALPTTPSTPVTVAAVPEPATWAMMLVGFGAIGAAMRRRRQGVAVRFA